MSSHPDLRAPTGKPRGPGAYGAKAVDPQRDELRDRLRRFEAQADSNDPEQQAVLARMREETRELEYLRGVWDKRGLPGVTRDWNAPVKPGAPTPKEMLLEFQEWKASVERERCLLNGLPLPPALQAGEAAALLLEAAKANKAEAPQEALPPPAPVVTPRKKAAKPITWARALTKQQVLALLDRQCEAEIWMKCGASPQLQHDAS